MEAKIQLAIGNNSISLEGSEAFVKEQADIFYEYCSVHGQQADDEDSDIEDTDMAPKGKVADASSVRDFYSNFSPSKPAESALVLAGWLYTQRGSQPFDVAELKKLFDEVGVPMAVRLDMTIKNFQREGKKLFQTAPGGLFRPTVNGENYFKAEMKLKPPAAKK